MSLLQMFLFSKSYKAITDTMIENSKINIAIEALKILETDSIYGNNEMHIDVYQFVSETLEKLK